MTDYYKLLDVQKDASPNDIKKAYRKLAVKHHPDKGGDSEKFKQIAEAYEVLSNPDKKQQYDNFGSINMDIGFNPMDIFNQFDKMFGHNFTDPNNIMEHKFSGFPFHQNQSDGFNGLNIFMNNDMSKGMNSFSQTTIIKDGKNITKTTQNGKTTIREELMRDPYMHFHLQ